MAGETDANAGQRRYWNEIAGPRWVAAPGFRERRNQESLALLLARLGLVGGESVLEVGCGTGALTLPLAAAVGEHGGIVAIDISEPMLQLARQRVEERGLSNVTLRLGDAQVFAFESAVFDLATSRMGVMFLRRSHRGLPKHRQRCEARRPARFRLLGAARGEPALAYFLRHCGALFGAARTADRS